LDGYAQVCEIAAESPQTQVVSLSDRAGDIYEFFLEPDRRRAAGKVCADWILRAKENRRLHTNASEARCLRESL
jgi:hypothetical protein